MELQTGLRLNIDRWLSSPVLISWAEAGALLSPDHPFAKTTGSSEDRRGTTLPAKAQLGDERTIAFDVLASQIRQQAATASDHSEEPTA